MNTSLALLLIALAGYAIKSAEQRQRIAWLSAQLQGLPIENLMQTLTEGYLRALKETDAERSAAIWSLMLQSEQAVARHLERLARQVAQADASQTRVSRFALALPLLNRLWPSSGFDLRQALALHAQGVARCASNAAELPRKAQAHQLLAELMLFQHTCHWYCRSKAVASARLLARHQTQHAQVLAAVSPDTRQAYLALLNG